MFSDPSYMHTYTNALAHGRIHVNTHRRQWLIALIFGGCVEYWLKFEFTKVRHGDIITCTLCGKALCSVANRHRSLVSWFGTTAEAAIVIVQFFFFSFFLAGSALLPKQLL